MKSISIAAPVFNEALNIENCINTWVKILNELNINDYEIILCDDKSTDNSVEVIEKKIIENSKIKLIKHEVNLGAAQAVITAGKNSKKERILFVDSDGQFPYESIRDVIISSNKNENDCIFAARETKKDSLLTRTGTKITTLLFNIIYAKKLSDISCILKVVPQDIYKNLLLESTGLNVSTEMSCRILELKASVTEVFVKHKNREFGTSSAAGLKFIKHGIKRISILKYFLLRRIFIFFEIISPQNR